MVVLCSDHGEMNGDYGLIYKGNRELEERLRLRILERMVAAQFG